MSFAAGPLRRAAAQAPRLARGFKSSSQSLGGSHADGDHYIHAKHMYEITNMKNRKLKFGAAIIGIVTVGLGLPFFAVHWQISKAAGPS